MDFVVFKTMLSLFLYVCKKNVTNGDSPIQMMSQIKTLYFDNYSIGKEYSRIAVALANGYV